MNIVDSIEKESLKDIPSFKAGDTVSVYYKIKEGEKERIQIFEGIVISRKGSSIRETFTVRKISYGIGTERIFPIHSKQIDKIEVIRKVEFAEQNFTISEDFQKRPQELKKVTNNYFLIAYKIL